LSSNLFFCNYSLRADSKIFEKYAPNFHIGKLTGIDITNEAAGQLSSPDMKKKLVNEAWYPGDNCNLAIGQGYTVVTPMQMLSWVTAIANNGEYIEPKVAEAVLDEDKGVEEEFGRTVENNLGISEENLKIVREGMHQGVQVGANGIGGTGGYLKGSGDLSSKTGTAEATVKKDGVWVRDTHAWVVGFFPYDKPKYSFVLFLEGGGVGGNDAAPIMRKFIDWFIDYEKLSFEQ
ncbi:hypothetical protein KC660_01450, partial [Candidatus Dojkabacteria bacterium]|nr:hypothetical protein [Candidatus Dojkabacteria bacterium]